MTQPALSDNYIIRIYRYNRRDARRFLGTVEEAGKAGKRAFATIEELWDILACPKERPKKPVDRAAE